MLFIHTHQHSPAVRWPVLAFLAFLVLSAAAFGQPVPATDTFALSPDFSCALQQPTVLELSDGSLITAWTADDGASIRARGIPATGSAPGETESEATVLVTGTRISEPRLLAAAPGFFHLLWHDEEEGDGGASIKVRRFTAQLEPRGLELEVVPAATVGALDATVAPDGTLAVAFRNGDGLWLRLADDRARPLTDPIPVASNTELASVGLSGEPVETSTREVRVIPLGTPGWQVAAIECAESDSGCAAVGRRFDATGEPRTGLQVWLLEEALDQLTFGVHSGTTVVALRAQRTPPITAPPQISLLALPLDFEGRRSGDEVFVDSAFLGSEDLPANPAVAVRPDGTYLVAWETSPEDAEVLGTFESWMRWFGPDGGIGPAIPLAAPVAPQQRSPAAAVTGGTGFVVAWEERSVFPPTLPPACPQPSRSFARRFAACQSSETILCIGDRFAVETIWVDPRSLDTGLGFSRPLRQDTGAFWFFEPSNLELMVKVLDGTVINDRFWLFTGPLTDLEVNLRVVDTATGATRTYRRQSADGTGIVDTDLFPALHPPPTADDARFPPPTSPEFQALPLAEDRFRVRVSWRDPRTGDTGSGVGLPLSDDTGTFWFFSRQNLELMIKVLDGTVVNDRFWVFWSALTDLELEIRVEDRVRGAERVYLKPAGDLGGRLDTAFPLQP